MRSPTSPPEAHWHESVKSRIVSDTQCASHGDELGSIGVKKRLMTIRKATNVIRAKNVTANDSNYDMALAA
jgi:hypothetical protein